MALLRDHLPYADDTRIQLTREVSFIDPGANFEGVFCPTCDAELGDWWGDAMNRAYESHFADLMVELPCCGLTTSLNDPRYEWPAGFARFVLQAMNPGVPELSADILAELERTLGCNLRVIWAHL